jgi:hypothetical protein
MIVQVKKKRMVDNIGRKNIKAGMENHMAMIRENQTGGCIPCQT